MFTDGVDFDLGDVAPREASDPPSDVSPYTHLNCFFAVTTCVTSTVMSHTLNFLKAFCLFVNLLRFSHVVFRHPSQSLSHATQSSYAAAFSSFHRRQLLEVR